MRSLWKMTLTELKLYLREPIAAFFTLVFPVMLLLIFGSIYGNEPEELFGGRGTVDMSVPAYMAMIIGTVGMLSTSINVATSRELGILRRYRATPLRPWVILVATVVVNFVMTFLGTVLLIVVARLLYELRFEGDALGVLAGFVLSALSFFSLGFVIAGLAPTARVAQVAGMLIFYPMLFLSGAGMPKEIMPEGVRTISSYLPLTHVVDLLQGMWFGEPWADHLGEVAILAAVLVVGSAVAARVFRWE
jgi:ABC-2 type transport system permease protein